MSNSAPILTSSLQSNSTSSASTKFVSDSGMANSDIASLSFLTGSLETTDVMVPNTANLTTIIDTTDSGNFQTSGTMDPSATILATDSDLETSDSSSVAIVSGSLPSNNTISLSARDIASITSSSMDNSDILSFLTGSLQTVTNTVLSATRLSLLSDIQINDTPIISGSLHISGTGAQNADSAASMSTQLLSESPRTSGHFIPIATIHALSLIHI